MLDPEKARNKLWIHGSSFTYKFGPPESLIQTLWVHRAGWGYIKRRDLWVQTDETIRSLQARGFYKMRKQDDLEVTICNSCGLYIESIPGYLIQKHMKKCSGSGLEWIRLEDIMINSIRLERHEKAILKAKLQAKLEAEEQERRDRHDRIREEYFARQQSKDRKKRLKEETRQTLRKR